MSKAKNKITKATKTVADAKKQIKTVTTPQEPEKTPVEAPVEEVVEPVVEPTVKEEIKEPAKEPVVEKPKKEKKKEETKKTEEPIVVEPEPIVEEPETEEIAPISNRMYDPADRIDANHQVDLMKMVHSEYVANPNANPTIQTMMKKQFDAMAVNMLMRYNEQVEKDYQTLGIKVTNTLAVQMEKAARELYGITLKGLPIPNDPNQRILEFKDVPQEVKKEVKKDIEAESKPIPEPDPQMSEKDKISAIESIFAQTKKGGFGKNLLSGIEWARKAYSYTDKDTKEHILANLFSKNIGGTLPRCMRSMVLGKMSVEHSILGVHSLMKTWMPSTSDSDVANLVRVITSYAIEHRFNEFDQNSKNSGKYVPTGDINNEFSIINRNIVIGCDSKVINAISDKTKSVNVEDVIIPTENIRKSVECAYGNSDSIIKDKLNEIAKYYTNPIPRLEVYVKENI